MRDKVLNELKNKYKDLGFNATDMGVFADFITPMVKDESEIGDAIEKAKPLLQMFQQNSDRLRGEKSKAEKALKKLQDQITALEKSDNEGAEDKKKESSDTPAWAAEIIQRLAKLEGDKIQTSRKSQLEKAIEKLPDSLKRIYGHIDLKALDEEGYNSLLEEVTQEAKDLEGQVASKKLVFNAPLSIPKTSPKDEPTDKQVDDLLASMGV